MERDFSENSRQKMISMISEIEKENWTDVTDFIGDRWYDFESWIGLLNIGRYLDNVGAYHKKLIDRKNYSVKEINAIFDEVNQISDKYAVRLAALLTCLEKYKQTIHLLSETVSPVNGCFTTQHINSFLKKSINDYNNRADIVEKLINEGYDEKDFEDIDSQEFRDAFSQMIDQWVSFLPNGKVEKTVEVPIGSNLVLYYKVSIKGNVGSNVDVETVANENKLKFKDFKIVGFDSKAKVDQEGLQELSHDFGSYDITLTREGVEVSAQIFEEGNTTYTTTYKLNVKEFIFEEEVSTKVDGGEVTNKIGLKKENQDLPLKPIVVPAVEEGTIWDLAKMIIPNSNMELVTPLGFVNDIKKIVRELSAKNNSSSDMTSIGAGIGAGLSTWGLSVLVPCFI